MSNLAKKKDDTMYKAIKYRIYPNEEQIGQITQPFGCSRFIYNKCLELEIGLHEAEMGFMSYFELNNFTNKVFKVDFPFLRDVDKFAINNAIQNLTIAYKNFFQGNSKFPKFKSKDDSFQSYTTNYTNNNIAVKRKTIMLPKLGLVEASIHRQPFKNSVIKSATVSKDARDYYYVSILYELPETKDKVVKVKPTIEKTLGIDYSSPHF